MHVQKGCPWLPRVAMARFVICALLVALPITATGQDVAPDAERRLAEAVGYLAGLPRFEVESSSSLEVVLHSGQKLQFDHAAILQLQRPDRMRAIRLGELVEQELFFDGQNLTLVNLNDGFFATVEAPGELDGMLDFARDALDIVMPASDLLYSNALEILTDEMESGFVVGQSIVAGQICDHLAFRKPHVDIQLWVRTGDAPLPCKMVITSRDVLNAPQFEVVMTGWNLDPEFPDGNFTFTPPKEVVEIEFLRLDAQGPAR